MANELPALPFFTSDFLIAVATWPTERVGAYALALFHQWEHEFVPSTDASALALIFHTTPARARRLWAEIASKFDVDNQGRARNFRLEEHRAEVREKTEKSSTRGREGARVRWQKERLRRAQVGAYGLLEHLPEHNTSNSNQNQSQYVPPYPPAPRGAARVSTNPPTREERKSALAALRAWRNTQEWKDASSWKDCPHEPPCPDETACVGRIVQDTRIAVAEGQELSLAGRQVS